MCDFLCTIGNYTQFYHQNNITPTTHIHGKKVKYKGDSPMKIALFIIRTKTV